MRLEVGTPKDVALIGLGWKGREAEDFPEPSPSGGREDRVYIPLPVEGTFQDPQRMSGTVLLTEPLYMLTIVLHIHTNDNL